MISKPKDSQPKVRKRNVGKYSPKNPSKYKGNVGNIVYRSLWELKMMKWLDTNDRVVWWQSEELIIPYRCKTDGRMHRYFVDFTCGVKRYKAQANDSERRFSKTHLNESLCAHIEIWAIEIKPHRHTIPPIKTRGKSKETYLNEVLQYAKNTSKWEAARQYCADRNMIFKIFTEKTLYG